MNGWKGGGARLKIAYSNNKLGFLNVLRDFKGLLLEQTQKYAPGEKFLSTPLQ